MATSICASARSGRWSTALRQLGITASAPTGCPPVMVEGRGNFGAGRVEIDGGLSSQYVSALLMAAPYGTGPIDVALTGKDLDARGYVDLTLAAMRAFGAKVEQIDDMTWRVEPTGYVATDFAVEPDASAATYLWAAEALTGGAIDLGVPMDAFTQPDAAAAQLIKSFPHMPAVIDGSQMQDAVPTLAVLAAFNETPVRFIGIANLRVKECDRISALVDRAQPHPARARARGGRRSRRHGRLGAVGPDAADPHRDLCRPPHRDELCACRPADRRHHDPRSGLRRQDLSRLLGCAAQRRRQARASGPRLQRP